MCDLFSLVCVSLLSPLSSKLLPEGVMDNVVLAVRCNSVYLWAYSYALVHANQIIVYVCYRPVNGVSPWMYM